MNLENTEPIKNIINNVISKISPKQKEPPETLKDKTIIKAEGEKIDITPKDIAVASIKKEPVLKLPEDTYKIIKDGLSITRGRIKKDKLKVIPKEELKKIYEAIIPEKQLTFDFIENQDLYLYTRNLKDGLIEYYIPKNLIYNQAPSFPLMKKSYIYSLIMAFEQKSPIIKFTMAEKLKKMGYTDKRIKAGGKIFKEVELSDKALVSMHFHYLNNKRGKARKEMIGSLYNTWYKEGEGKGAVYTIDIRSAYTQKIDFTTGQIKEKFYPLPLSTLAPKKERQKKENLNLYKQNIELKLKSFIGLPSLEFYGEAILEWANLPDSLIKHRRKIRNEIYLFTTELLQKLGFKRIKTEYNEKVLDFRKWKFIYEPPKAVKTSKKASFTLTDEEKDFVNKFVEWQCRKIHYGKKGRVLSPEKIREQITNTIKVYGFEIIKNIFVEVNRINEPSPKLFWNRIKGLKKQKGF